MTIQKIIRMGNPILRLTASEVTEAELQTREFAELIQDLKDTMVSAGGIGIAAPQIGISKQVALIEIPADSDRYGELAASPLFVIINPKITILGNELQGFFEGCLSVPGMRGYVERPSAIHISFLNLLGVREELELTGFLATVFQHELDHLFGKLYVDRIADFSKFYFNEEYLEFCAKKQED